MRIDFEKLRDAGWEVHPDKDGVTIMGTEPFKELAPVTDALKARGLGSIEAEVLVDEFYGKIEGRLILAALE